MSIAVYCTACKNLVSLKNQVCKCGKKLSAGGRIFYAVLRPLPGGRKVYRRLRGSTLIEARIEESLLLKQLRERPSIQGKSPTFRSISDAYLRRLEILNKSAMYQADSRRFLRQMEEAFSGEPITKNSVEEFRLSLRARGLAEATCDRYLAAGRAAWSFSLPDTPNPFKAVKFYNPRNVVVRFLSPDQRVNLLRACHELSRPLFEIVLVAMTTGLRKGNVLNLRRDEINWTECTATVTQKGGRSLTIPIPSPLLHLLSDVPQNGSPFFWVSPATGKPFHIDWRRLWKKAKSLSGISDTFRFHDLRHDRGTSLFEATGSLRMVQLFLGHSDSKVTERYAHVLPATMSQTAEDSFPVEIVEYLSRRDEKGQ